MKYCQQMVLDTKERIPEFIARVVSAYTEAGIIEHILSDRIV